MISMPSSTGLDRGVVADHAYSSPEYIGSGETSSEADVYSLGMVLFEVMCGRLCTEDVDGYMLSAKLVKDLYEKKKLDELVDPILREQKISSYSVNTYSAIAYRCLLDDPKERPSMGAVIKELEELLQIELFQREQPLMTRVLEKLEIATKNQEFDLYEHEEFKYEHWELKLQLEIRKIIKMVKLLAVSVTEKQIMWLLHKGILFDNGEMVFSRTYIYALD